MRLQFIMNFLLKKKSLVVIFSNEHDKYDSHQGNLASNFNKSVKPLG